MKRFLSMILIIAMVLSMVPAQAFAAEPTEATAAETIAETTASAETETVGITAQVPAEPTSETEETVPETMPEEIAEGSEVPEETAGEVVTEEALAGGACGDDLQWSYSNGILTITGSGAMKKYYSEEYVPWYYNRERITQIILPEGLTVISQFSFYGCANLMEIALPSTLEGIEKSAFANCASLRSLVIPDKVRYLKESVFYGCESLETVVLGSGMVTLYENAFMECRNLRQVNLGSSLKYIKGAAFCYCENLEALTIPESVEYIYENAFATCGIRELTIEGNPSWSGAVFSCPNLEVITIGSKLETIPNNNFYMCPGITDFVVDPGNPSFSAKDGVLFDKDRTTLLRYTSGVTGEYQIPEGVTQIGEYAFYKSTGLTRVKMPDSLTGIQENAFSGCTGLTHVAIPDNVTEIDGEAFLECTALEYAEIGRAVQHIRYRAFQNCQAMTKVVIPDSVTELGNQAFLGCTSLGDVTIGSGVKTIGKYAFSGCTALTGIVLPNNVTSVGESVFSECTNLKTVTLSQRLTSIPQYMFNKSGLTQVTIPDGVTTIGNRAFAYCEELEEVSLSEGLVSFGEGVFEDCDRLTSMILPDSVTTLGKDMFSYCANLETVVLGSRVSKIENYTFMGCDKLRQIVIPVTVTSIGNGAFRPSYGQVSALQDVYYGGSEEQWAAIVVGTDNGALETATIHYHYSQEGPVLLTELRFYDRWDASRQRVFFGDRSSAVTAETDEAFLADPEALLGSYVLAEVLSQWGMETLITMQPVETRIGYVSYADSSRIVIDGIIYDTPADLENPGQFAEKHVTYHLYEGNIVGIELLTIAQYFDNNAITINGSGTAYAYYKTAPNQTVAYIANGVEGSTKSDSMGVLCIPLGSFRTVMKHRVPVQFTRLGEITFDPPMEVTATVTVQELSFAEKWKLSMSTMVGVSANVGLPPHTIDATLGKVGIKAGGGAALSVSYTHADDGDSLEITSDYNGKVETEFKLGPTLKGMKETKFALPSASANLSGTVTGSYSVKFDDYSEDNFDQQKAIAITFFGEMLRVKANSIIYRHLYEQLREWAYEDSGAVISSGSGAGVSGKAGGTLGALTINDKAVFTAGSASLSATATFDRKSNTLGEEERKSSYQVDGSLDALAVSVKNGKNSVKAGSAIKASILGVDTSVTAKNELEGDSLKVTYLGTEGWGVGSFLVGKKYTAVYESITFRDEILKYLTDRSPVYRDYVSGVSDLLGIGDIAELAEFVSNNPLMIPYSEKTKQQVLYTLPISVGLGVGIEANLDLTLSYQESTEYDSAMGYVVGDETLLTSRSDDHSEAVKAQSTELVDIIQTAMASLWEKAAEFFETVYGLAREVLETAWCRITGNPDSKHNRRVSVTYAKGGGGGGGAHSAWAHSYNVDILNAAAAQTTLPRGVTADSAADENYALAKAATVGRPFVIGVTDNATGESVADFSDEPLEFTIRYALEDLEAVGLNPQSAVVLDGGIAMYRYNDENNYFEYIGGTNDLEAMAVTAEITRPGQYVLAVDSCAPALSDLEMSDFREKPTIMAHIDDLTGLDMTRFVFRLDGAVKVDGNNVSSHFDPETGWFTYAVTEALAEGEHTMSFTLADTTGNSATYEYSFHVDLTAPVVSDVTVTGSTNSGSALEIRARVSDENLTSVMALLSKKLDNDTWTAEVGVDMGDMGDGLWGLDYEGDGSSLNIRVCAVDAAGNETFSDVFACGPYVESVEISQDYIVLRAGQTLQLTAAVRPAELAESLTWTVEAGGKTATVDQSGIVTAKTPGTVYVIATATDGEREISARCRVDVTEKLTLDGVKLGSNKLTTELYSTDYTKVDVLLMLPQNYSTSATESAASEKLSAAISEAYFTDEALRELFNLKALDDRTLEIIPTYGAIIAEKPAKSYTGTVTVIVEGTAYETEALTLDIKTSLPKLKVMVPAFNAFCSGQSQKVQVSGVTVTGISAEALPEWLTLCGTELALTESAPRKNASAKVNLEIMTEEWAVPIRVTTSVKSTYKAPGLKLSASSVQLSGQTGSSEGVRLQLLPKNKKETLAELKVSGIVAPEGYRIENYDDGSFTLKADAGFVPGKISLEVTFSGTRETVKLPITVKTTQVKLKPDKSSVYLNAEIGDSAVIGVTAAPDDYVLSAPRFRLVDSAGNDKLNSGELVIRYGDNAVRISTTDNTPLGGSYTLYIRAGGSKEVAVKIKIIGGSPVVSLKQRTNLDLSFEEPAVIAASFKNYAGGRIENFAFTVTETRSETDVTKQFEMEERDGAFYLSCADPGAVSEKEAYVLDLKLTLADGRDYEASLKLKIKRTAIKLKLSAGKLTLNKAVNDAASVAVTCTAKGYEFTKPVCQLMDKSGKQPMDGKLTICWNDGELRIATNNATEYGATYKLLISAAEGAAATALTVAIPAENKSAVTATLKVKGNLDVIRNSSVIVTPSYKNCQPGTEKNETLIVVRSDNKIVTDQFDIVKQADNTYRVSIAKGAEIDLTKKHQFQMRTAFGSVSVTAKPAQLKIKMGSAKVIAETESTLFAKDKNSRLTLHFTGADAGLNSVAKVEIKDAKLAEIFEIFDYGNGEFAIGFKNGKTITSAKPITLSLDVFLEGNTTAKPNAAVKLKLSIAP